MSEPRPYRWKLDGTVVETPEGYENFVPSLARHEGYRGIFQIVAGQRIGFDKDGKTYIDFKWKEKLSEAATALVVEEYNYNTYEYEPYIVADLDYEDIDVQEVVTDIGIKSVSFTQRVLAAEKTPINIQSLTDLDGVAITPFADETHEITLHSQVLVRNRGMNGKDKGYNFTESDSVAGSPPAVTRQIQLGFSEVGRGNLGTFYTIGSGEIGGGSLVNFLELTEDGNIHLKGNLDFDVNLGAGTDAGGELVNVLFEVYARRVQQDGTQTTTLLGSPVDETDTDVVSGTDPAVSVAVDEVLTGVNGDKFYLFAQIRCRQTTGAAANLSYSIDVTYLESSAIGITQESTTPETACEVVLVWEYLLRIIQAITGQNDCLISPVFGRTDGAVRTYSEDGKYSMLAITNGAQVRNFPLADAPTIGTLLNAFENLRAMFNIGMGVRNVGGSYFVIFDDVETFYDSSNVLFTLSNVNFVSLKNRADLIFNQLSFGYKEWQRETGGGLDTPNSSRKYSTGIRKTQNTYTFLADWITAGTYLEETRRKQYSEDNKEDDRADKKTFGIWLKRIMGGFAPDIDDDYTAITGITRSDTVYNMKLTPARMLLRHASVFKGCLNVVGSLPVRFQDGDGNYQATTQLTAEGSAVAENENFDIADLDAPLWVPVSGETEHEITKAQFAQIQANPEACIILEDAQGNSFKGYVEKVAIDDIEEKKAAIELLQVYEA